MTSNTHYLTSSTLWTNNDHPRSSQPNTKNDHPASTSQIADFHRQIIDASPIATILVDALQPDLPIVYVNAAFERMTGYTAQESLGRNCRFLHGNDVDQAELEIVRQALREQQSCQVLLRNYRRDGSLLWNEIRITPLHDHSGRVTHFIGVQNDVTQQVQTEQALQEKNAELEGFFSLALDLLCIADTNGHFLKLNRAWETTLGYPLAALEGQAFLDFVHPEDIAATRAVMAQLDADQPIINFVNRYRAADGSYRYIEWRSVPYPSRGVIYAAARDITERVCQETQQESFLGDMHALQQLHLELSRIQNIETLLRRMIRVAQQQVGLDRIGIFLLDETGDCLWGTYGVDPHGNLRDEREYTEAITPDHWTLEVLHSRDHTCFWPDVMIYDEGEPVGRGWKVAAALWNGHRPLGYICTDNLLSGRAPRPYETEIISLLGSVFGHLIERYRLEERAIESALEKERVQMLSQFIQVAAHEFRTPLAMINTSTYLLTRTDDPQKRQQKAANIEAQVQRITRLLDMMLRMTQLHGSGPLMSSVDLYDLLHGICQAVSAQPDKPRFSYEIAQGLPAIQANAGELRDALTQLVDNALRFTAPEGNVALLAERQAAMILITIHDTGWGIAEHELPHIFDTFWRRDEMHSTPGFGLGLAIARRVIERHNGHIDVSSVPGVGSSFRVSLPVPS